MADKEKVDEVADLLQVIEMLKRNREKHAFEDEDLPEGDLTIRSYYNAVIDRAEVLKSKLLNRK